MTADRRQTTDGGGSLIETTGNEPGRAGRESTEAGKESALATGSKTGSRNVRRSGQQAEILTTATDLVQSSSAGAALKSAERRDGHRNDNPAAVDWMTAMGRAIRSPSELRRALGLPQQPTGDPGVSFPTFVPWEFVRRMRPGDERDPLLIQVLPAAAESDHQAGFGADPVGDLDALATAGLIHKYHARALIISAAACGIHCRYCFRREFPYQQVGSRRHQWQPSIDYLASHDEVEEVILSGGDPLTLDDRSLQMLIDRIEDIAHVRRLRIHTRMPIAIPQRITEALIDQLSGRRFAVWMVVHINHPREIDADLAGRLGQLVDAGIPLLNQSVLLRGVNDDADTLIELSRRLVDLRIQPYYLHQLDRVRGAGHFEVPVAEGLELMDQIRSKLPGYAVPSYVVEQRGRPSKTPLTSPLEITSPAKQHVRS